MHERNGREVPARLSGLGQRFAVWRKNRVRGERIPKPLWKAAAKLAVDIGIHQTAAVLKLDYYSLKKRVDQHANEDRAASFKAAPTFVELPSPPVAFANECVIELEDGTGASMRMHLKGTDCPDVLALGRSFWNGD